MSERLGEQQPWDNINNAESAGARTRELQPSGWVVVGTWTRIGERTFGLDGEPMITIPEGIYDEEAEDGRNESGEPRIHYWDMLCMQLDSYCGGEMVALVDESDRIFGLAPVQAYENGNTRGIYGKTPQPDEKGLEVLRERIGRGLVKQLA